MLVENNNPLDPLPNPSPLRGGIGGIGWAMPGWLAAVALLAGWIWVGRQPVELIISTPPLGLRLDAVTVAIGEAILLPASLLLSFQLGTPGEKIIGLLAIVFAELAIIADSILLLAFALGCSASMLAIRVFKKSQNDFSWRAGLTAGILLLLAGALLQAISNGAFLFSSVPVNAFTTQIFLLIFAAALLCWCWIPWIHEGEALSEVLLLPLGFLLLARAYTLGGGSWPTWWLNWLGIGVGILIALSGGLAIQWATNARQQLAIAVRVSIGLALAAFSLGTPLGVAAGLVGVGAASWGSVVSRLYPLRGRLSLVGVPLAVGAPPGLAFVAWFLALMAFLEAGGGLRLLVVVVGIIWLISWAGLFNVINDSSSDEESWVGGYISLLGWLVGGAGVGVWAQLVINPAVTQLINSATTPLGGSLVAIQSWSGSFAALGLGLALVMALLGMAALTTPITSPLSPIQSLPERKKGWRWMALPHRIWKLGKEVQKLLHPIELLEQKLVEAPPWLLGAIAVGLAALVYKYVSSS